MMRWKKKLTAALLVCGGLAGCKQQLYMTLEDNRAVSVPGLPKDVADSPGVAAVPTAEGHFKPATVDDPDRPVRFLSLAEAFAISLETGTRALDEHCAFISTPTSYAQTTEGVEVRSRSLFSVRVLIS
jgi:hypothetical protein